MNKQSEFIYNNIKRELIAIGHTPANADICAMEAKNKFENGGNWPMGKVFETLLKEAKKSAGKPPKKGK